jgi:transposase
VTATMTFAGLDVHARSIHAAAIDVQAGELRRVRFGARSEEAISWLQALPQPVRACYEAGPTGFALYRAAEAAGVPVEVVAPSKTPRAPGDRIKTDRKDAELLARLLLAGQLKFVTVPSTSFEAARHLCRAREQVRSDLMRCRHRVSKLLLLHGRVYPRPSAWTKAHRGWLEQQRFDEPATELAYLDTLAAVDGVAARKAALDERLSRLALEGAWWPTVSRRRRYRQELLQGGQGHPAAARTRPLRRSRRLGGALASGPRPDEDELEQRFPVRPPAGNARIRQSARGHRQANASAGITPVPLPSVHLGRQTAAATP